MKRFLLLMLLVWAVASSPRVLRAQNTPFQNPSLDSNCYFPQIGDPSEMDTIVGAPGQSLGSPIIKNLGPRPDGSFGNMLIGNLVPPPDQNSYTLSQMVTGPGFNLHQMKQYLQKFDPGVLWDGTGYHVFAGHFRDRSHLDLLASVYPWRIYWADDDGNYDTSRFTVLIPNIPRGNHLPDAGIGIGPILPGYIAHLTSDTVDDIIVTAYTDDVDTVFPYPSHDTAYALLYRGGSQLYGKDTVSEDTSAFLYALGEGSQFNLQCTQADFRGVGRDDLIVSYGDMTYYRNDPPFSLEKFALEITKDTLFSSWHYHEETDNYATGYAPFFTMRALPKSPGDSSVDLLPILKTTGDTDIGIFIFRGGPNFGSKRLRPDSAAFVITHPAYGFSSNPDLDWPLGIADAGDMTGTGNHVIHTVAGANDEGWDLFYVTGKALDNKVDIWNSHPYGSRPGDTLTANGDSLEDYLYQLAQPYFSAPYEAGSLWLYYGTKQIPVHLNPQWAEVKSEIEKIPKKDGAGISFVPNPIAKSWSVATIVWPDEENAEYGVYDLLGRECQHGTIRLLGGAEEQRIYFSGLPAGVYIFTITGKQNIASTRIVKLGEDSGGGTPEPSFIQQVKDARDEPEVTHGSHLSVY